MPLIAALLAMLLLVPAAASAARVDEQREGQDLIAQLQAGTKTCKDLSAEDFDHIGEYVMFRALGSTSPLQATNDRMTLMLGEQAETRTHQLLGARYAGCPTDETGIGSGSMMGGGMTGGYYKDGGWGAMMQSSDWSWMMGGSWQHMTRQDWNQLESRLVGTTMMGNSAGWSAVAIIGITLAGAIVVLLAILVLTHRWPFRRPPAAAPSS
jgi:hypothetical protein